MNFIFLPVGTVCKIKNNNSKVMIIGYDKQLYYRGVVIPQGLSIDTPQILFNSNEITSIISLGYIDNQVEQYGNSLTDNHLNNELNRKLRITENKYKFDESGFITEDKNVKEEPKRTSQYKFDDFGIITEDGNVKEEPKRTSQYKFDDFGIITEDGNIKEEPKEISQYKFDDFGIITEDGNVKEELKETSQYKFDESGFITEDKNVKEEPKKRKNYQFDENGFVISE